MRGDLGARGKALSMTSMSNQLMVTVKENGAESERLSLSQSVLDHAPVGMVITSADDAVNWANVAMDDFLGISPVDPASPGKHFKVHE